MSAQCHDAAGKQAGNYVSKALNTWILDSGATDHICCRLSLFDSFQPVHSLHVTPPKSQLVEVSHIGAVTVSPLLILGNMLFIPVFAFNLISLSKLF